uniref:Uncharacterized protein n=1 Tax=Triticum urartu TaxID=4572 RepID=A0A8R7JY08_TRIUA
RRRLHVVAAGAGQAPHRWARRVAAPRGQFPSLLQIAPRFVIPWGSCRCLRRPRWCGLRTERWGTSCVLVERLVRLAWELNCRRWIFLVAWLHVASDLVVHCRC